MQTQVSPIAAFIHGAPQSAVGKETREPRGHERQVKEQERDKMGDERAKQMKECKRKQRILEESGSGRLGDGERWRRELKRGGKEHVTV